SEAEISLSSPEFFLRDVTSALSKPDASIRKMQAAFVVRDNTYTIRSLSGQINNSPFNLSGSYSGGGSPEANLSVTSSNLDIDDFLLFTSPAGGGGGGPHLDLKLKLAVDAGNYGKLQFTRLNLTLSEDNGIFYLQ